MEKIKLSIKQGNAGPDSVKDVSRRTVLKAIAAARVTTLVPCVYLEYIQPSAIAVSFEETDLHG
jgi:hypothetical protein